MPGILSPVTRPHKMSHRVLLTLMMCALGVAGNYFSVPLFFGVDFIFGSVAAFCALTFIGPLPALFVAAFAGAYTYVLWGHPYAIPVFLGEIVFAWLLRKKIKNIALADAVYWLFLGLPIVVGLYCGVLKLPYMVSVMVALKQSVNGVLNASVAATLFIIINRLFRNPAGISLVATLFNCLLISILVPGVILIAMETRRSKISAEQGINDSMKLMAKFAHYSLKNRSNQKLAYEDLQAQLRDFYLVNFLGLEKTVSFAFLDQNNRILAKTGEVRTNQNGERLKNSNGLAIWLPHRDGQPEMVWWKNAFYYHAEPVDDVATLGCILIEYSAAPVVEMLHQRNLRAFLFLFGLTAFAILAAVLITRQFSVPLKYLGRSSQKLAADIEHGNAIRVPESDFQEIKTLARSFKSMAISLAENFKMAADRTNRLEQLSQQLAKYLSPQIYQSLFSGKQIAQIKTERKKLTLCFTDLCGFTAMSSDMQPEDLTYLLNSYFAEMSIIATRHGGTIDKFIGDGMVIFFGDPETKGVSEDARSCVRMAVEMQQKMAHLVKQWRAEGLENTLQIRIGINTGFCNVGNFGSDQRMDYTIIGAEVNLAARLETIAEAGSIMISGETHRHVADMVTTKEVEIANMKGITRNVRAFAITDIKHMDAAMQSSYRHQTKGLSVYVNPDELSADKRASAREHLRKAIELLGNEDESTKGS